MQEQPCDKIFGPLNTDNFDGLEIILTNFLHIWKSTIMLMDTMLINMNNFSWRHDKCNKYFLVLKLNEYVH